MHGTIVCGVTGAPEGRAAAQLAAAVANRLGLRLVLVHVVAAAGSHPPDAAPEHEHLLEYGVEAALDAIALDHAGPTGAGAVETRIVAGNRVDALVQVAAEEGADVIVLGSRPRGARGRQLRCSLARELEAAQSVPVLIAPPATRRRSSRRLALAQASSGR